MKQGWEWEGPNWKNINDRDKSPVGFKYRPGSEPGGAKEPASLYPGPGLGQEPSCSSGRSTLQDGTVYLKEGEKATDKQIWYLPQLLEGMEGASK